jgi:hypothetical protein
VSAWACQARKHQAQGPTLPLGFVQMAFMLQHVMCGYHSSCCHVASCGIAESVMQKVEPGCCMDVLTQKQSVVVTWSDTGAPLVDLVHPCCCYAGPLALLPWMVPHKAHLANTWGWRRWGWGWGSTRPAPWPCIWCCSPLWLYINIVLCPALHRYW